MRKLAAIMFTDIDGFTAMMQNDEAKTVTLLEYHKQLFLKYTGQYKGRIIKYIGDGTLTIFTSVIQAVNCAVALQQAFQKAPAISVRIGIHLGEVILENKDVIGDAVNLSSRIQTSGVAGGVLISEKVRDELKNHPEIVTLFVGAFHLKNVLQPVNLYAIVADGLQVPNKLSSKNGAGIKVKASDKESYLPFPGLNKKRLIYITSISIFILMLAFPVIKYFFYGKSTDKIKVIVVLPFKNIGQGEVNNYLAEGLTEEIISLLSANSELTVKKIPFSVTQNYNEASITGLLKGIEAGSVLEGSVQHDKDSLRIFVRLRNTETNQITWAETYNRQYKELMNVQQQVASQIAEKLKTSFGREKMKQLAQKKSTTPEAYDLYMRGRYAQNKRTPASMNEAIYFFKMALREDSAYALAYSGISDNYVILIDNGYIAYEQGIDTARSALNHAFLLDSTLAEVRASKAIFLSSLEGRRKEALTELQLALKTRPNYAAAQQWYAVELAAESQFDSAIKHINSALKLEPFSERIWSNKTMILTFARRYREAINLQDSFIIRFPGNNEYDEQKTKCYYWLGKKDSALFYANAIQDASGEFWKAVINRNKTELQKQFYQQLLLKTLDNEMLATYYIFLGQKDKALTTLLDAYTKKEFRWLKFLNVSPTWDSVRNEPVFNGLLVKLGFK